jgi:hypothetical protein
MRHEERGAAKRLQNQNEEKKKGRTRCHLRKQPDTPSAMRTRGASRGATAIRRSRWIDLLEPGNGGGPARPICTPGRGRVGANQRDAVQSRTREGLRRSMIVTLPPFVTRLGSGRAATRLRHRVGATVLRTGTRAQHWKRGWGRRRDRGSPSVAQSCEPRCPLGHASGASRSHGPIRDACGNPTSSPS